MDKILISTFLLALIIVTFLAIVNKQYRKGEIGEALSFFMLSGTSVYFGSALHSALTILFFIISPILALIGLMLLVKARKNRNIYKKY
ncbi:hypothetical protein [Virgibacillus chiguensis]|uniref:YesK-like protein n=1 Tax=Virgibacillus chiguensis TaxID=411959 RepID=A0A1M5WBE5_9BACI|nr:hypothetical protein [Virgibacillus chiguensis]SHH84919.1 hypothetical protein SAMN05421807_115108 [Virgibacillus chiguensis]